MAKKLLVILFLLNSFAAFSYDSIIISDFDDTIKRTNVDHSTRAVLNSVFTQKIFSGMNDLYQTMDTYTANLYVLSNSPNLLRFNIFKLLRKFDMAPQEVSTRNLIRDRDGFHYKYSYVVNKIKSLDTKVILVGDDVGEDPEVYSKIKQDYPRKVQAIYIHRVKNRELPQGVIPYYTSFDIALNEYQAKRMNLNQAYVLGEALEYDYDLNHVFPKYTHCPKTKDYWSNYQLSELEQLVTDIANKITKFCHRSSNKH